MKAAIRELVGDPVCAGRMVEVFDAVKKTVRERFAKEPTFAESIVETVFESTDGIEIQLFVSLIETFHIV
eukprot:CAMPEP_0204850464 /NCGR_PEP_ID=MMETSP1347-20130617/8170_1 /ASSEMBLY_ACC=CAM_ASM_000690 /TAXON_ID=215587 /ORGANISM="Aplanochytrium stocchinoi, Strain GSBS06" /LENGTH=69 /DNA_ID=CAMNT_0051993445 /DNA_START=482 /DNA_END=691 /DNA_ORIENTATION=+